MKLGLQDTLRALADPIRREILSLLKGGRLSAGEIGQHFPVTAAAISRHLSARTCPALSRTMSDICRCCGRRT